DNVNLFHSSHSYCVTHLHRTARRPKVISFPFSCLYCSFPAFVAVKFCGVFFRDSLIQPLQQLPFIPLVLFHAGPAARKVRKGHSIKDLLRPLRLLCVRSGRSEARRVRGSTNPASYTAP